MEKEINKPNDIFVSTLLNPTASVKDLVINGINSSNTDFLTKDEYKNTAFVKKSFTDEKGVFNNEAFENAYAMAERKKDELDSIQSYQDFSNYAKFNDNDILAPLTSPKTERTYEIQKVRNPLLQSEGVSHLFGKGENDKSQRELAQMHKVWDSKNQKWLDYTAEDLGIKYLFKQSLVYAKWDEDGTHFDKSLGREVKHRKGEWKTDDDGLYYTETIDNNEGYGKEFVAFTDILTKEDSKLNKIDFFDSDDKHKSKFGTVMKTVAKVAPYFLIPNNIWGAVTASIGLLEALPTLAKMGQGIVTGDKETAFTKQMNTVENFWNKLNPSYSDEVQGSLINFESIMNTISDVFGQLYQMRAAAQLGQVYKLNYDKTQQDAYKKFAQEFGPKWAAISEKNKLFKDEAEMVKEFKNLWTTMAEASPYMKEAVQKSNKISKALSLGYMSLASGTDTYQDAIQGGYDRRMAGIAALTAMTGQYALMMNNQLGNWFLEGITGDKEGVSRKLMRDVLKPYWNKIAEGTTALAQETTEAGKAKILSQILDISKSAPRKLIDLIKYGGEEFWQKALIEGVEEVTEEAVMDMTKGVFDAMSYFGVGKNSDTASFGGWENTFSREGAERYLMNFIGGFVGGAMFPLQQKIEKAINNNVPEDVKSTIVNEIIKGNTDVLLSEIDRMAKSDTQRVRNLTATGVATNETVSRGEMVGKVLKEHVKHMEGIIQDLGFTKEDWNTEPVFKKIVRDKMLQKVIESSGIDEFIEEDFIDKVKNIINLETELAARQTPEEAEEDKENSNNTKPKSSEGNSEEKVEPAVEKLKNKIKEAKADLQDFLSGKQGIKYLSQSLAYLHPKMHAALGLVTKDVYTQSVYGVSYQDVVNGKIAKNAADIDREYAEWRESSDNFNKFRKIGVEALDELEKRFSPVFKKHVNSDYAKTVRVNTIKNWLRDSNFTMGENVQQDSWRKALIHLSDQLAQNGLKGISLEDQLNISDEMKQTIADKISEISRPELDSIFDLSENLRIESLNAAKQLGMPISDEAFTPISKQEMLENFKNEIIGAINQIPTTTITTRVLNEIIQSSSTLKRLASTIVKKVTQSLGENVSNAEFKNAVDQELLKIGITPNTDAEFNSAALENEAIFYVQSMLAPKFLLNEDAQFDPGFELSQAMLAKYVEKEEILDAELVKLINTKLYKELLDSRKILEQKLKTSEVNVQDEEDEEIVYDFCQKHASSIVDKFLELAHDVINQEGSLEDMIHNFVHDESGMKVINPAKYEALKAYDSTILNDIEKIIKEYVDSMAFKTAYEEAKKKVQKANPFYDALGEYMFQIGTENELSIFQLIKDESTFIGNLESISEYIRQGDIYDAIETMSSKLELMKAVLYGMENIPNLDPEHQIGYNIQRKQFAKKYGLEIKEGEFETLDTNEIASLLTEIDLVQNKLNFLKTLSDTNTLSKTQENEKTREALQSAVVRIITPVTNLTLDGVSFEVPTDKMNSAASDEERLGIFEHFLFESVQSALKQGKNIKTIVQNVFDTYNLRSEGIFAQGLNSAGLSKDLKSLSAYDMVVYLTAAMASDSHEFLYKFKNALSQDSYKYVPLFTQEYAAKLEYAFLQDTNHVFQAVVDVLYKDQDLINGIQKGKNIFFVNGIAGAGKTTAVQSLIASMVTPRKTYIIGPNKKQAETLKNSVSTQAQWLQEQEALDKSEILNLFLTPEAIASIQAESEDVLEVRPTGTGLESFVSKLSDKHFKVIPQEKVPKLLIIDEITHFSLLELDALSKASEKYGFKILTSGDTLQNGAFIKGRSSNINDIFTFKSPALTISVRSSNAIVKDNTDMLQAKLRYAETYFQEYGQDVQAMEQNTGIRLNQDNTVNYHETNDDLHGAKFVETITAEDVKKLYNAAKRQNSKLAIIDDLDADGHITNESLKTILKDLNIDESELDVYSPESIHKKAVQGSEAQYFIITSVGSSFTAKDSYEKLISLYTYLTRAQTGTLILDYGKKLSSSLGIINSPKSFSGSYTLPGQDRLGQIKQDRIGRIDKIINDYVPAEPVEEETTNNVNNSTPQPVQSVKPDILTESLEETLSENEYEEIKDLLQEGEVKTEVSKKEPAEHSLPPTEKNKESNKAKGSYVRGYSYYTRLGVTRSSDGKYLSTTYNTHLDLDNIFARYNNTVYPAIIKGFTHFQKILTLYPDVKSEAFQDAIKNDAYIWRYLETLYRLPKDNKTPEERKETVVAVALDPQTGIQIEARPYIYAKKYDNIHDAPYGAVDVEKETYSHDHNVRMYLARRISAKNANGDDLIHQYITCGVLKNPDNMTPVPEYMQLIDHASNTLTDTTQTIFWALPTNTTLDFSGATTIRSSKGRFYSIDQLQKHYGIIFDTYQDGSKLSGRTVVNLIKPTKSTVNGIESYDFLHYIAHMEPSNLSYKERIDQLTKAFVDENGKLVVSGKYYSIAGLAATDDSAYKRVVILEPKSSILQTTLEEFNTRKSKSDTSEEKQKSIFNKRMDMLSMNSSIKIFTEVFKALGALDIDGNPVNEGLKPYFEYIYNTLTKENAAFSGNTSGNDLRTQIYNIPALIQSWSDEHGDAFGLDFLSYMLKKAPSMKVFLLDQFTKFIPESSQSQAALQAKQLPVNGGRQLLDVNINLKSSVYKEFGHAPIKVTTTFGDNFTYQTVALNLVVSDLNEIGMRHHIIQSPKFDLSLDNLKNAKKLTDEEAKGPELSDADIENLVTVEEEVLGHVEDITAASLETLKQNFNPKQHCVWNSTIGHSKNFYEEVFWMEADEQKNMAFYSTDPQHTNGFEVRPGDTIQLFGDTKHNYRVKKVIEKGKKLEFESVNGVDINAIENFPEIHWGDVSAITHRRVPRVTLPNFSDKVSKEKDYYRSQEWIDFVNDKKESQSINRKVIDLNKFDVSDAESLVNQWESTDGAFIMVPVLNSDKNITEAYQRALTQLKTNPIADVGWKIINANTSADNTTSEQVANLKNAVREILSENPSVLNGIIVVSLKGQGRFLGWNTHRVTMIEELIAQDASYVRNYIALDKDNLVFGSEKTPNIIVATPKKETTKAPKVKSFLEVGTNMFKNVTTEEEAKKAFESMQNWFNGPNVTEERIKKEFKSGAENYFDYAILPNGRKMLIPTPPIITTTFKVPISLKQYICNLFRNELNLPSAPLEEGNYLVKLPAEIDKRGDFNNFLKEHAVSVQKITKLDEHNIKCISITTNNSLSYNRQVFQDTNLGIEYIIITPEQFNTIFGQNNEGLIENQSLGSEVPKENPEEKPQVEPKQNPTVNFKTNEQVNFDIDGFIAAIPEFDRANLYKGISIDQIPQLIKRINELTNQSLQEAKALLFEGKRGANSFNIFLKDVIKSSDKQAGWNTIITEFTTDYPEFINSLITSLVANLSQQEAKVLSPTLDINEIAEKLFDEYLLTPMNIDTNC